MKKRFFVMLNNQAADRLVPLIQSNDELAMFATLREAMDAARKTPLGEVFGFEVFEAGQGE